MIVIIEGPDGAGKTSLARTLARQYHLVYRHEGPPPAGVDPLAYYLDTLHHVQGTYLVFDRFALGERVYGPALRGTDELSGPNWTIFKTHLRVARAQTILCLPSYDVCFKSWSSGRTEMIHKEPVFQDTYRRWSQLAQDPEFNAIDHIYDYTRDPLPELHS